MRRSNILAMAMFWWLALGAASITPEEAKMVAQQFITRNTVRKASGGQETLKLVHTATSAQGEANCYVFNISSDGGFVIVGGDDVAPPVWAYSESGAFDTTTLPENVRWWLDEYGRQLQWLLEHPDAHPRKATNFETSIEPLLTTKWNQGKPYNNWCPAYPEEYGYTQYGNRACTGCMATATAQIMKYYHWPVAGIGQNTYTCDVSYGGGLSLNTTLSANFWLSTYDWSSMMDDYDYRPMDDNRIYCRNGDDEYVLATQAQQDAVAKLMSDVGIAMEMDYGSDYSAGKGDYAAKALERYFQYRDSWKYISRNTYKGDWDATLRKELDELRPILYCGSSSTSSHALVFDGYRSDGYFHINWGWGGRYNGYFMSSLLNPIGDGRYAYNGDQYAYIGIQPDHEAKPAVYPITPGDVNADKMIDIDDVNLVINQMVKKVSLSERQMVNADCHRDGVVDIDDMNEIINMMVGKSEYYQTQFETFTVNGVSFKMAKVSGGTFLMGATADQIGVSSCFDDDEHPIHPVTLSGYSIGVTEVTQALWQAVMGSNPSFFSSSNGYADNLQRPVEHVDWYDCQTFITKLNTLTGMRFRLPSEAEWEFAARGGNMSKGYKYAGSDNINDAAWYWNSIPSQSDGTSGYGTQTVATKMPNELGLYDMSGNVWEWCQDWFNKYSGDAQKNPTGPESGSNRVFRGGGWDMNAKSCRVSERDYWRATINTSNLGLRLAR